VLTSTAPITNVRAREILTNDFGSMWTMQLDGGGSTQYYHAAYTDNPFWGPRAVPEVLAIYAAP
jgi:exopolysaccharide biosynthesis protein